MSDSVPGFRLSPQQKRLWRLQQADSILRAQCVLALDGDLDADRLSTALRSLVDRHEILRTGFVRPPGVRTPVQVVHETGAVVWRTLSQPALDEAGQAVELEQVGRREGGRPIDLEGGQPLQACLVTLEPGRHQLFLTLPALCADAASLGRLARELAEAYAGTLDAEEPVQYLQYSEWKHELLQDPDAGSARRHWLNLDARGAARLRLPWERGAAEGTGFSPASVRRELDRGMADRLAALAGGLDAVLVACWQVLLARITGEPEPMIGCVLSGRRSEELAGVIGPVAETVPVAGRIRPEDRFADVLARVAAALAAASEAQDDFPADELFPPGETGPRICFEHQPLVSVAAPGLRLAMLRQEVALDRFAVKFVSSQGEQGLSLALHYDPALLGAKDAERLIDSLRAVAEALAQDPSAAVGDLNILGDAESRELLVAFNDTRREVPRLRVHELFEQQAGQAPGATAMVYGERSLSYGELEQRANQLAWHLRSLGFGPDRLAALYLDRSPEMLIAMLAVWKAGGAYLPLDTGNPPERLAFLAADAQPAVLVTEERLRDRVPGAHLPRVLLDADREAIARRPHERPAVATGEDHLAYVLYTSGSTGRPKGVMVAHRGLMNYLSWAAEAYGVAAGERSPVHSPLGFDLTVTALFAPLLAGGTVELLPEDLGVEALAGALRSSAEYGLVKLTPSHLDLLERQLADAGSSGKVRSLVVGGEALFAAGLESWWQRSPETRIFNEYGPTETVVGSCVHEAVRGEEDAAGPVAIGRPIANTRIYVVDPRSRPVPAGVPGEIWIGGAGVARGYCGRPDLTAERFVPDPFSGEPGARLYRTGDLARHRREGGLEFLGRNDDQVKVRGFRIELGEVEAALKRLPGIREAAVLAREDEPGSRRLVAYLVAAGEASRLEELRSALQDELPEPMIPAAFVWLDALPLTANGKVDRSLLPAPDAKRPDLAQGFVAPRTPVEEVLAEIFGQVLGLDRVGIHDSFFTLGGDSIRSVRLVAASQAQGLIFTVQQLFRHQTIAQLADYLQASDGLVATTLAAGSTADDAKGKRLLLDRRRSEATVRSRPFDMVPKADRGRLPEGIEDAFPLSMVQSGMLSHMEREVGAEVPPAYHNVNSFHLRAPFEPALFQEAVQEVVARHPMLRTSFDLTSYSEPLQLVHRHAELRVAVEDLRPLPTEERERELQDFIRSENQALVDLTRPPLLRFRVHRLTDESFQLTLTEPHSISDGWSTTSTLAEIFLRYLSKVRGQPLPAEPPPPVLFRDFVRLERQALASAETKAFWDRMLSDRTVTQLPRWPAPLRQTGEQQDHKLYFLLEPEMVSGLRRLAETAGVTLKSVVVAAHHKVMSLMSGERDLLTGLVFNGRPEESGGTDVRGLFLNTLPFRLRVGDGSWVDLARAAFEAEVEILPHRRYPLGALQKQWGRDALFEVAFGYLNFHSVQTLLDDSDFEILPSGNSDRSITHFPLMVIFDVMPAPFGQARLILEYDLKEHCEPQMRALYEVYHEVLAAMAAAPGESHSDRCFQTPGQRLQVAEWNRSAADYPRERCVHHLFEETVRRAPEAVALVSGERRMTFAELDGATNRLAHHLRSLGVGPDVRVGLCLERGADLVIGLLGILKAGGAYVPLDPALPRERLAFMLRDAEAAVLITREGHADLAAPGGRLVLPDADAPKIAGERAASPAVDLDAGNLAYVMYTSGSTGTPKGVMIPHRGLVNYLSWCTAEYRVAEGNGAPVHSSIGFDLTVTSLFSPLLAGRTVTLLPDDPGGEPLVRSLAAGESYGLVKLTPAHLDLLSHHLSPAATSVGTLVVGGEALTGDTVTPWLRGAPGTRIVNEYGPTETVVGCTAYTVPAATGIEGPVPIGRPVANARVALLDERLIPVPVGAPGDLLIGGDGLARGYQGRPDLTAAAFLPDPSGAEPGARLYRTGDRGRYLPDGNLEYLGRADRQVKVKGYRIELGEIEAVLTQCPGVRGAAVLAREDTPGDKRLVAYVVTDAGVEGLRETLAARLPEYMLPTDFVALDVLPLTANGKVDRRALPAPSEKSAEEVAYVAPRNPVEEVLAGIWAQALGLERVGVYDNFFSLGGDSITALLTVSKAKSAGLKLASRQIFRYPTIAELALVVEEIAAPAPQAAPASEAAGGAAVPLTPIQSWFFAQDLPDPHHFNQALLLETRHPLQPALLERVADLLRTHHPALRARFVREPDGWKSMAGDGEGPSPFLLIDLSALPPALQKEGQESTAAELQHSLDLERGRLWCIALYDLGPECHGRLFLVAHHLAVDGVSWRILLNDLQIVYHQLADGEQTALPAPTTPFDEWARRLRTFAGSAELAGELPFWSRSHPVRRLPRDFDGRNTAASWRLLSVPFGEERTARLQKAAQRHGAKVHELLLAALALALVRWTGESRLLIDLEGHGREEPFSDLDLSRTVGWFTSLFPLTLDLGAAADPALAVREVSRQLRAIPNRGIGYGVLRYLAGEETARTFGGLPQAEISFNYLGQFDQTLARPADLALTLEPVGPLRSPAGLRSYVIELSAQIVGHDLQMDWMYSGALHRRGTIEGLATACASFLEDLLTAPGPLTAGEDRELILALEEAEFEGFEGEEL